MLASLLGNIVAGTVGLWLSTEFIPGVEFRGSFKTLLLAGLILGLINFFIKPIIKLLTIPLRILTLGLFGLIINMGMVWLIDVVFGDLIDFKGIIPLLLTTILVSILSLSATKGNK